MRSYDGISIQYTVGLCLSHMMAYTSRAAKQDLHYPTDALRFPRAFMFRQFSGWLGLPRRVVG